MSDAQKHYRAFLEAIGFAGDDELVETPEKVAEFMQSFAPGKPPPSIALLPTKSNTPILLQDLPFHSLCAHHLVPFFGHAKIAYLPNERIAGFGCLVKALHHFARQPQLQERLGEQLANHLLDALEAKAVFIELSSRQMCMEMRGVQSTGQVRTFHRAYRNSDTDAASQADMRLLETLVYG